MSHNAQDTASVRAWFDQWGHCVANVDFASARTMFDDTVSGFGTYKDTVQGLDALEVGQWRSIWPTIKEFKFLTDNVEAIVSEDRLMCYAAVLWSSVGVRENGEHYDRPGRATVALKRADLNAPWRGFHTHFSEFPQERQKSFGGA